MKLRMKALKIFLRKGIVTNRFLDEAMPSTALDSFMSRLIEGHGTVPSAGVMRLVVDNAAGLHYKTSKRRTTSRHEDRSKDYKIFEARSPDKSAIPVIHTEGKRALRWKSIIPASQDPSKILESPLVPPARALSLRDLFNHF